MSHAVLTLHFRDEETLRDLERAAEALGVSTDDLAEAAIERELAAVGAGFEARLSRALAGLKRYDPADLEQEIQDFAHGEVEVEDPIKARLADSPDAYGIGALFGHPVERG
jgi:hypothetical protein